MGKCYNSIEINTPIDDIWKAISNFHDMSWAPDVITSVDKVGEKGENQIGAKRILNDAFHETLTKFDATNYTYSYSIDDGPGPVASDAVSNYIGVVKLSEKDGLCLVEWSSSFDSANEDEVSEFCNPIYQALLAALKDKFS